MRKSNIFAIMFIAMCFISILTMPTVMAKDPKTSTGENNLEIKVPFRDTFSIGEVYEFAFHIENKENGVALTSADPFFCDFHLYGSAGNHIWDTRLTNAGIIHGYDLEFVPDTNNFSEVGTYGYNIYCECDDCSIIQDFDDLGGFAQATLIVNPTGESYSTSDSLILIFLAGFFVFLGVAFYTITKDVDFEKWYNKIATKYKDTNGLKVALSCVAYGLVKDSFIVYYLLGWPILLLVQNIITVFGITSIATIFTSMLILYGVGFFAVVALMFGHGQEFIMGLAKEVKSIRWGS